MELLKYCKSEFNLLNGCKTLQLGTAAYYRNLDPALYSIADEEEGFLNYMANDTRRLGFHAYGNISSNPYLFCVSTKDMPAEEAQVRFGKDYDSRYYIKDAYQFGMLLGDALSNQLTMEDLSERSIEELQRRRHPLRGLMIRSYMDIVKYRPFNLLEEDQEFDMTSFELFRKSHFTKREQYQEDYEYRYMFTIGIPNSGYLLSFSDNPKILFFRDFTDWSFLSSDKVKASNYFVSE